MQMRFPVIKTTAVRIPSFDGVQMTCRLIFFFDLFTLSFLHEFDHQLLHFPSSKVFTWPAADAFQLLRTGPGFRLVGASPHISSPFQALSLSVNE